MICKNCGAQLNQGQKFCTMCGTVCEMKSEENPYMNDADSNNYTQPVSYSLPKQNNEPQLSGQAPNVNSQYSTNQYGTNQYSTNQPGGGQFGQQIPPASQTPYNQYMGNTRMSLKEFYKLPEMKTCRTNITVAVVCMYISAVVSFLLNVLLLSNPWILLDCALMVGMALGIQIAKSRACAVITAVYSIFNGLVYLLESGTFGGWLIIAAAFCAVYGTFRLRKAYDKYQSTGYVDYNQ